MASEPKNPHRTLRGLIWLYLFLLIFEGAARKWIVPSLSNQLLLIRDPVVLAIYFMALISGVFPFKNGWIIVIIGLGAITLGASVLAENFKLAVALFGFRTNFLHLPLIFVMAEVLNLDDIRWVGKWIIITAIPMAYLMAAQFKVGEGHWLNAGAGEGASQIISAMGKLRASGTFSFITGPVLFFPMVAGFLFYSQLKRQTYHWTLVWLGFKCVGLAAAIAGSRSLLGSIALEALGFFVAVLCHPPSFARSFRIVVLCGMTYVAISAFDLFKEATNVMKVRIEQAGQGSPGFWSRIAQGFDADLRNATLFGKGLGVGTNAGAAMLGRRGQFLIAENEWQRITGESGFLLGPAYILLRLGIAGLLLLVSLQQARAGNLMPMLMASAIGTAFVNGQFSPPTVLGFAVFGAGCCLAAANTDVREVQAGNVDEKESPDLIRTRKRARFETPATVNPAGVSPVRPARPTPQPGRWTVRPPGHETKV